MSTQQVSVAVAVVVALVVTGYFFIGGNFFTMSSQSSGVPANFAVQDTVVGNGPIAKTGDRLTVNYTGRLENGTVFDTSIGGTPFSFTLGAGEVIVGWDLGLQGMQAGGKRTLVIPPEMAYGSRDYGPIPGNSTLRFDVELLSITPADSSATE